MFKSFIIGSADEKANYFTGEEFWDLKNAYKVCTEKTLNMIKKAQRRTIFFI